jgi:RNA recognition motif-containing protein
MSAGQEIFVGGLPEHVTEEAILKVFRRYGKIEHVSIAQDVKQNKSKGFGFVKFAWPVSIEALMQDKDDIEVLGCKVKIKCSK